MHFCYHALWRPVGVSRLTHDAYGTYKVDRRQFRTSLLAPMAVNVGFVLFECNKLTNDNNPFIRRRKKTYRIVAYHNERPIFIERCNGISCDWEDFKEAFKVNIVTLFSKLHSF